MDKRVFGSRLQKGGALLDDMRNLVVVWPERNESEDLTAFVMSRLDKPSSARARDTYNQVFKPRFLQGSPKEAWSDLEKGRFDWAKQAMRYWPERVRAACEKNRSFALAHGVATGCDSQ